MVRLYKYGFYYKNFNFGWYKKKLYRLPSESKKNNYPLKQMDIIPVGKKEGYRIVRDKKTIDQLMEMTELINFKHIINGKDSEDTPF
jgi:hypothetical protein